MEKKISNELIPKIGRETLRQLLLTLLYLSNPILIFRKASINYILKRFIEYARKFNWYISIQNYT